MVELQVTTNTGMEAVLEATAVEEFRKSLRGRLILPAEKGAIAVARKALKEIGGMPG